MITKKNPARRRPQQRSAVTRERLVEAALREFAANGFTGASTRAIAARADVAQSAIPFHFSTKEALWKAAADSIMGRFRSQFEARATALLGVDAGTRMRLILTDFVRFAAKHPYFHQFMLQEGTASSERLEWLAETHITPILRNMHAAFSELESEGIVLPAPKADLTYMLIGAVSTRYALAPEFHLTTDEDPFDKDAVEAHAASVIRIFFPQLAIDQTPTRATGESR